VRARLSLASVALSPAGSASRQCICSRSSGFPLSGLSQTPPERVTMVGRPRICSSRVRAKLGLASHSTDNASPSATSTSAALRGLVKTATGGAKTTF
jgi:hypothetical protein